MSSLVFRVTGVYTGSLRLPYERTRRFLGRGSGRVVGSWDLCLFSCPRGVQTVGRGLEHFETGESGLRETAIAGYEFRSVRLPLGTAGSLRVKRSFDVLLHAAAKLWVSRALLYRLF